MVSIVLLILFVLLAWRVAPRERPDHAHVHGAGQIALLAAVALFGVDYFTSYYYATGEMLHVLHPYGLQNYAYLTAAGFAITTLTFLAPHSQRGWRILHGLHALPAARCQPDRRDHACGGLHPHDRGLRPLRWGPASLDPEPVRPQLGLPLPPGGRLRRRHVVPDDPRARGVGEGRVCSDHCFRAVDDHDGHRPGDRLG